jgi:cytochrome c553
MVLWVQELAVLRWGEMTKFLVLLTLMSIAGAANSVAAEGDPDNGKALARTNCARCHGVDGNARTTSFQPVPMLAGQPESYLLQEMRNYASSARVDSSKGQEMTRFLKTLSDDDFEDIAAFYAGQRRY